MINPQSEREKALAAIQHAMFLAGLPISRQEAEMQLATLQEFITLSEMGQLMDDSEAFDDDRPPV